MKKVVKKTVVKKAQYGMGPYTEQTSKILSPISDTEVESNRRKAGLPPRIVTGPSKVLGKGLVSSKLNKISDDFAREKLDKRHQSALSRTPMKSGGKIKKAQSGVGAALKNLPSGVGVPPMPMKGGGKMNNKKK